MRSKPINFTLIKVTLLFISGIVSTLYVNLSLIENLTSVILLLSITILIRIITRKSLKNLIWLDILLNLTIVLAGSLTVQFNNPKNFKNHYTNHIQIHNDSVYTIQFKVREVLKPNLYHDKYIGTINSIDNALTYGKLLINIKKDTFNNRLSVDDVYQIRTSLNSLNTPLNPYQFNYKTYLNNKHIYHQLTIKSIELFRLDSTKNTLVGYASKLRDTINKRLRDFSFSNDELAIINALLLGQRQGISKDVYESYTKAGAIHILAVSGLHVGIILMLLHYLFKPLNYFKKGRFLKMAIIVISLWCYALVAGLSPSVVRAVSMFTVFAIAMNLKRPTNSYNTVAISMFFLLLFKPMLLFNVGFQMSYLAVLSIITIEPMLYKLWRPKFKITSFFWQILTVTLAAQIGVAPISLFYFHQFPGLFFLSNLVIIPCLGFILGFGLLIIVFALLHALPNSIANCYAHIISLLNNFVNWVSQQEEFIFQNISFTIFYVVLSYLLIVSTIRVFKFKTFSSILILAFSVLSLQGYLLYEKFNTQKPSLIVFHKHKHSIIGVQNNKNLHVYHSLNDSLIKNDATILNYKIGEGIRSFETDSLQNVYHFNNKKILVIDSLGVYNIKHYKPNFILLRNSPRINLNRLIDSLQPELIISDGSNYKSYQERWKATCETKKIPFHQTNEKGSFIYR